MKRCVEQYHHYLVGISSAAEVKPAEETAPVVKDVPSVAEKEENEILVEEDEDMTPEKEDEITNEDDGEYYRITYCVKPNV